MRDAVRCHDLPDRRDRHDLEGLLGRRDLDHLGHRIRDPHRDHRGAAPCRDDQHLDHPVDQHLGSSDVTDHRCRLVRDRAHSVEFFRCVHRCHRDAVHLGHDPSVDAGRHRDDGIHLAAAGSDDHCLAAAESDDHSARDVPMDHPAAGVVRVAESGAVLAHLVSTARRAPNHP